MSKFYEEETEGAISNRSNDKSDDEGKIETLLEDDEAGKILQKLIKQEEDKKEILKLTMLINKYTSDFEMKRNWSNGSSSGSRNNLERYKKDVKCTMFFNKGLIQNE